MGNSDEMLCVSVEKFPIDKVLIKRTNVVFGRSIDEFLKIYR